MAWKGYAPYKQKEIPTPDVQKNDSFTNLHIEKVSTSVEKGKDNNPVTGSRKARKQKPVTWS